MNLQRLNELYTRQANANSTDAENLVQLCRDYPYFRKPYVVLAKYYFDSGHYRFEDALRQAAMRVRDRKALYEYIHGELQVLPENEATGAFQDAVSYASEEQFLPETSISELTAERKPGLDAFLEETTTAQELPDSVNLITETDDVHRTDDLPDFVEAEQKSIETEAEHVAHFVETLEEIALNAPETYTGSDKPLEFEFEGRYKLHEAVEPLTQEDIIGEEIATEFSFSRHKQPELQIPADPIIDTVELSEAFAIEAETASVTELNNTDEEPLGSELEIPDLSLRKYPVYSIDSLIHELPEPEKQNVKSNDLEPSMDFFAWLNHPQHEETAMAAPFTESPEKEEIISERPVKSLDIIERFIAVNPQISRPKKEFFNPENMAKRSEVLDLDFVSETLANIYYEQGNYDMALKAYEKLSLQNPAKQAYFASLIEKITQERK